MRVWKAFSEFNSERGRIQATKVVELVNTDVGGPVPVSSLELSTFSITFTDDHSRFCWIDTEKEFKSLSKL